MVGVTLLLPAPAVAYLWILELRASASVDFADWLALYCSTRPRFCERLITCVEFLKSVCFTRTSLFELGGAGIAVWIDD